MSKPKQVQFNVQKAKFCLASDPGAFKDVAYISKFAIQKVASTTQVRGDGETILEIISDQGYTGALTLTTYPEQFLIDMKYLKEIHGGVADVAVFNTENVHLYLEILQAESGQPTKVIKQMLYNVVAQKPDLSFDQNEDNPSFATFEIPITVFGTNLLDEDGIADYINPDTGMTEKVWRKYAKPIHEGYASFGTTYEAPKVAAEPDPEP